VDRITRKELKQDKFAVEVTHTVGYLSEHRTAAVRYGVAGLIAIVLIAGVSTYRSHQRSARSQALTAALEIRQAPVGPSQPDALLKSYANEADKQKAEIAAFSDIASKYSGSEEGTVAQYYLATIAADRGNLSGAEQALKEVIDNGSAAYASMAKLSLAEIYKSQGKAADGEKLIRSVIQNPTEYVSKEQATIALARYLASTNPAEARKLLEPLRAERNAISRVALAELQSLPAK
jgi:predicted negative regulator of RcsB-dependent stress response